MLILLASLCCICQHAFAYNLATDVSVIRRGSQTGSYFGFSVATHTAFDGISTNKSWLLVGAPKANSTALSPFGIVNPGVVYKCDFLNSATCDEVEFDKRDNQAGEDKNNQWFGVSLHSSGHDGYVLACAHRLLYKEGDFYTYPGRCFGSWTIDPVSRKKTFDKCQTTNQNQANSGGKNTINYKRHQYCQLGVSASFILEELVPLIGAPGVFNFQGESIYYGMTGSASQDVNELTKSNSELGYQGYSVAYGSFFKKGKMDVVSGAPRFEHHGMVVIFKSLSPGVFDKQVKTILPPLITDNIGERRQPGTGFGYSLCGIDLNNDGFSDLLVGAPFFSNGFPGQGKVYVYNNLGNGNLVLAHELTVKKWRANFGRAIASVGDIDLDGYQDVAIGAPYEDDVGVVYIYSGSKDGLINTPMQVIKGSEPDPGIKSFGYSLDGKLDMDSNGYPDILVGAYESDTVVLLRSKPVLTMSSTVDIDPATFDIKGQKTCNATNQANKKFPTLCFLITVCTKYVERSKEVKDTIDVVLSMESDVEYSGEPRVLFSANKAAMINATKAISTVDVCFDWDAYLREGVTDIFPDIEFRLTYKIPMKPPPTSSTPTELPQLTQYAVLDQRTPQQVTALLTFKRDCEQCVPNLKLASTSKKTLAVGAEIYKVDLVIQNTGDDAYNARLYVVIPKGITRRGVFDTSAETPVRVGTSFVTDMKLDNNDTMLVVKVGNPFKKQTQKSIQIQLDTSRYSDSPDFLPISLSINSTNQEELSTLDDNYLFLNISIMSRADLEVNGKTAEEQVSYGGKVVGESAMVRTSDIGNQVIHKYFVKNLGPDPVPSSEVTIKWPFEATNGKHLLYLVDVVVDGSKVSCDFKPGQLNMLGLETSSSAGDNSGQQQNDTTVDVKSRARREAQDAEMETDSKVKRETAPATDKPETELDCDLDTAKCTEIHCNIKFLQPFDEVTFTVISRLWNGTMIEDYYGQLVRVISHASVRSLDKFVQEADKVNNQAQVGTQLNPDADVAVPPKGLPKWVIPVCVVGAVLLLVLIVFGLYKLGFFKRQSYDKNMSDPAEHEGMLDEKDPYVNLKSHEQI